MKKKSLAVFLIIALFPLALHAKLIEPDGLLMKIIENNSSVSQFFLTADVKVYDPEALVPLEEELKEAIVPYELTDRSYSQNIIFIRDEFISIESLDSNQNALHVFIKENFRTIEINLDETRVFNYEDVFFQPIILFTKHVQYLIRDINFLGISNDRVSMRQEENLFAYQLGDDKANILVHSANYKVLSINRELQYKGRYYPLSVKILAWDEQKNKIPTHLQYFINSRLFKEVWVKTINNRGIGTKKNRLLKSYKDEITQDSFFDLLVNHAQ
ncbi:MAG: hypothetical protein OEY59_03110 [Deltaproteobacteria bacterium]|nr:hypothetical protein [Deltaproteobacteria bacterium]